MRRTSQPWKEKMIKRFERVVALKSNLKTKRTCKYAIKFLLEIGKLIFSILVKTLIENFFK